MGTSNDVTTLRTGAGVESGLPFLSMSICHSPKCTDCQGIGAAARLLTAVYGVVSGVTAVYSVVSRVTPRRSSDEESRPQCAALQAFKLKGRDWHVSGVDGFARIRIR